MGARPLIALPAYPVKPGRVEGWVPGVEGGVTGRELVQQRLFGAFVAEAGA